MGKRVDDMRAYDQPYYPSWDRGLRATKWSTIRDIQSLINNNPTGTSKLMQAIMSTSGSATARVIDLRNVR